MYHNYFVTRINNIIIVDSGSTANQVLQTAAER